MEKMRASCVGSPKHEQVKTADLIFKKAKPVAVLKIVGHEAKNICGTLGWKFLLTKTILQVVFH